MLRRDLSKVFAATAVGAALFPQAAQAQSCNPPCYAQTSAESAAGVTPTNYSYPPGNVLRYGADPTNTHDSTAAFQAAFKVASWIGYGDGIRVRIPAGTYQVSSTIAVPSNVTQFSLYIDGDGDANGTIIIWTGGSSATVFHLLGWGHSEITGIRVLCNTHSNVVVWSLDTNSTAQSTEGLAFRNCWVDLGTGTGNTAWQSGASGTGPEDVSQCLWDSCVVSSEASSGSGNTGWRQGGNNALNWVFVNCFWSACARGFDSSAVVSQDGGLSIWFFGCGSSGTTDTDFYCKGLGTVGIYGGRFENGKQFIYCGTGGAVWRCTLQIKGVEIYNYNPSGNVIFQVQSGGTLDIDGGSCVLPSATYSSPIIEVHNSNVLNAMLLVRGFSVSMVDPIYTVSGTTGVVNVRIQDCMSLNSSQIPGGFLQNIRTPYVAGNTGSTPAPALSNGEVQQWTLSANATWGAPTGQYVAGQSLTLILTASGSYTTAWNATYRNAPSWSTSSNGQRATATFKYDGTDWQFLGGSSRFATP